MEGIAFPEERYVTSADITKEWADQCLLTKEEERKLLNEIKKVHIAIKKGYVTEDKKKDKQNE